MRLLLAEDEKSLSKALVKLLEHEKYAVDPVYNGQDALEYLQSGNYDAAVLDIMMPKMDGLTVLKEIRKEGNSIPILLLTAKGEVEDRVIGLDSGANDYLPKPFNFKELMARIRAMTRTQPTADNVRLRFEDLMLDRSSFEIKTETGSMRLSSKEFQLMEFLMTNPGRPISSERLFEKNWGTDSESDINVVWVYISYLRRKLKALNAAVEIQSIRNEDYLLRKGE
ncbi:MAG: response regulator transcription factor [Eubacterium sp.]|jgi:two-component system response regulator ArlR